MSKSGKERKLKLLKAIAANQSRADKLRQENSIAIVQSSLLEKELNEMKEHLESLEKQRGALIKIRTELGLEENELEAIAKQKSPEERSGSASSTEKSKAKAAKPTTDKESD